ncbi:GroES-like protein [Peniophora sp. CONT]|nr:GroES-like protein [Peniophora sp. CONT]
MSPTNKALILPSKDAGEFTLDKRQVPTPGPGQLLVKVHAAALNPVDDWIRRMGFLVDRAGGFPAVPGSDGAGTIEAIGEGVEGWSKGDRVVFHGWWYPDHGTLQQYSLAFADRTCKIPDSMSFDAAATIPLGLGTASVPMYSTTIDLPPPHMPGGSLKLTPPWVEGGLGKYARQPIVVLGGSSSVGQFALQLAKLSGFSPIITTASAHNAEYCKAAGATHVVDYHAVPYSELDRTVAEITKEPIKVVYDAVSTPESQPAALALLASGGGMVVTGPSQVGTVNTRVADGKLVVMATGNVNEVLKREFTNEMYEALPVLLRDGHIKPNNVEVVVGGLAGVREALQRVVKGVSGVKLIVHPQETA